MSNAGTFPARRGIGLSRQTTLGLLALLAAAVIAYFYGGFNFPVAVFWVFGLGFGFVLQRSRFCFASAFRDLYLLQDGRVIKGIIAGMAVATIGFALVMYKASPDMSKIPGGVTPLGIHTLLGGLLFGLGMVLAGGCASGSLYRMGEGYVGSWLALGGMFLGMFALALNWDWWWTTVINVAPKFWLPKSLGWGGAILLNLLALGLAYLAVLWWESRGGGIYPQAVAEPSPLAFGQRVAVLYRAVFTRAWPAVVGGVILGTLNTFEYLFAKPWGITTEVSRWAGWIAYGLGYQAQNLLYFAEKSPGFGLLKHVPWLSDGSLLNWGTIFGAFVAALLAGEFKLRLPGKPVRYGQSLVGGILMGYGSRLAIGCNIGAFFSAIPALALNGWVFALGLAIGSYLGVLAIKRLA